MRVALFTSACTSGWCYGYEADEGQQAEITKLAEVYNSIEAWEQRNSDGSVEIYDSEQDFVLELEKGDLVDVEEEIHTLEGFFKYLEELGDGDGRVIPVSEIVRMLTTDPMADDWLPPL